MLPSSPPMRAQPLIGLLLLVGVLGCMATAPPVDPHVAARLAFEEGRLTQVIAHLQPLAEQGSASVEEMHMLADAYMRRGDGSTALATLEAAQPLEDPTREVGTLRKMGRAAALAGKYPLAVSLLRKTNSLEPEATSLRLLTRLLIDTGQISLAMETGQEAIRMDLTHPEGFVLLATALALDGMESQALTAARRAEALLATSPPVHFTMPESLVALGNIHLVFDRLPAAIQRYERAIQHAPSHVEAHQKLGLAKTLHGDSAGAVQTLQQARKLAPDNIEVLNNLGVALSELHLHKEAAEAYGEAHRLAPNATVVVFNQADALALDGRPLEAFNVLRSTDFPPDERARATELATRLEQIAAAAHAACTDTSPGASTERETPFSPLEDRILRAAIARCP